MTKLFLHIGRNKTGSTSVQDFCAAQADWLAQHGVRYALLGHLADAASPLPSFADQRQLADFVRGCGARAVFASNEMFTAFSPAVLRGAATDLAGLDLQIMLYMRPYEPWLRSCYSYDTRIGVNGRDFDAYARHTQALVSIWPKLRIWGEVVGWDRMRVRTTAAADLLGGDIIADCLATLGVKPPPGAAPVRSNAAPHWMVVELLRLGVGADEAPGWMAPGGLAIAHSLHELADQAIAATGRAQETAAYATHDQIRALRALYAEDTARIGALMGRALAPDDAPLPPARGFLPSAAHIPRDVIAHISAAAQRADYARTHPEIAAFVRGAAFTRLLTGADCLAPLRAGTYLGASGDPGAVMDSGVAERVRPEAAQAFELAGRGDLAGAVELGTRAARTRPEMELLQALANWRRDAFGRVRHPEGPGAWPPHYPDPFPGTVGIPEIGAAELTAEILGGAILHHGSLRVNGLVPPETVEALRAGIDRALAAQETANNERPVTDPGWYTPLDVPSLTKARQWSQGCGAVWTADCPPMLDATIEALRQSGALGCIAEMMGERPALSVAKSTLRRVQPGGYHDWHQDGAFLGRDVRSVNVWLALSDCGDTAPGMDIVGRRLPYVMPTLSHGACFDWTVGQGFVDILAEGGAPVVTPVFGPGDALLFDHLMLHRTSLKPGLTELRWAIESWFFAPTNYPYDQVPLYV